MAFAFFCDMEALLFVIALSADAFVASFAYGTNKIKIPPLSVLIISAVCTAVLALALYLGSIVSPLVPEWVTKAVCIFVLLILGLVKLFDGSVKALIRKKRGLKREIKFSLFSLTFILNIYADPKEADRDYSRVLSPAEAASLAIAVSLDGAAGGFGLGLVNADRLRLLLFSFVIGMAAVLMGCRIGIKIADKLPLNISWLSGVILIALALLKL